MSKRNTGVRYRKSGKKYEICWQINGHVSQHRVNASSEREAVLIRAAEMADYEKQLLVPGTEKVRLASTFEDVWERLSENIAADKLAKKTQGRYRNSYERMFVDFRAKQFPQITNPGQLSLPFFVEYKSYYASLGRTNGIRSELNCVKSMINRMYLLGFVSKELTERLKELKKPEANEKAYPAISKQKIESLLSFIRKNRPDYFQIVYFIYRTGRRIAESTLIEKKDVIRLGLKPIRIDIRAETTKKKKKAPIDYLDEGLERHIRSALSNNKTKWLFPNRLGNRCTPNRFRDYLKKVSGNIIGIEITPHYFRHRLCTEAGKNNISIADVQKMTGITDINTLLKFYQHSNEAGQKQVLSITG